MFDIYTRFPVWLWPIGPVILVWSLYIVNRIAGKQINWPRVNGTIILHKIERHQAQGIGSMYWPVIRVRYAVHGRTYQATFTWDAGISLELAQEIMQQYPDQGITSLQYAPFDPSIVRLRFSKVNNETVLKFGWIGGVGVLLTILTLLSIAGNLPIPDPQVIIITATAISP